MSIQSNLCLGIISGISGISGISNLNLNGSSYTDHFCLTNDLATLVFCLTNNRRVNRWRISRSAVTPDHEGFESQVKHGESMSYGEDSSQDGQQESREYRLKSCDQSQNAKNDGKDRDDKEVWKAFATAHQEATTTVLVHYAEPYEVCEKGTESKPENGIHDNRPEGNIVFCDKPNEVDHSDDQRRDDTNPKLENAPLLEAHIMFLQCCQLPWLQQLLAHNVFVWLHRIPGIFSCSIEPSLHKLKVQEQE